MPATMIKSNAGRAGEKRTTFPVLTIGSYSRLRVTDATGREWPAQMEELEGGARPSHRFGATDTADNGNDWEVSDLPLSTAGRDVAANAKWYRWHRRSCSVAAGRRD